MKRELRDLIVAGSLESAAAVATERRWALGSLVSLTYDRDPLVVWRAIETMGLACERLARQDPGAVREHMRRLNWLITEESGAICWRAPEAMAEIAARLPGLVSDYVPIVRSLLHELAEEDLGHFRGGVIWAIGRLGLIDADGIAACVPDVAAALDEPDSQLRGVAVWCIGRLGRRGVLAERPELGVDEGAVQLYQRRHLVEIKISQLVRRELAAC